jgi:hypothetical protein
MSAREAHRKNFNSEFLWDFITQRMYVEHDPRNLIGMECGVNIPRIFQVAFIDRSKF